MSHTIELLENQRLLYIRCSETLTIEQTDRLINEISTYLEKAHKPIYQLANLSKLKSLPTGMLRYLNAPILHHRRNGFVAVVGALPHVQVMIHILYKWAGNTRVGFFDIEEEAITFILRLIEKEQF